MMNFILSSMWIMSILFIFMNHPLSFGLILLIQTFLISILSGVMSFNFWFSYIIFLIMVGGMLVLFMYMTSIASNEKFKFSSKLFILFMSSILISFITFMLDYYFMNSMIFNETIINQNFKMNYLFSMNKYINNPSNMIFYMMIIYLFITLIAVVKITNINYGPLRQKF
uniref:NADH-ubiquinone oxidoreductase chain 6 n=1 Tax=Hymaea magna TaxID=1605657 RepID=A0A7G7MU67_9CUCU|nr:NADH dehydrogenase subunit 6 [Hymaea magna]QNG56376.1 NADH dehydrogenase subunit 6 [Hymaea magna]